MTFCVGIKVAQGLVALADTQIVKGGERLSKGKLTLVQHRAQRLFLMTSGLRSLRDKTVAMMMDMIRDDLAALNVRHDVFFSERSLIEGRDQTVLDKWSKQICEGIKRQVGASL